MCFAITVKEENVEKLKSKLPKGLSSKLKVDFEDDLYQFYYFVSGFSFPKLPVIKSDSMELYNWGLVPAWVKDIDSANQLRTNTLNAKSETVYEKPSFRGAIGSQRCIIPINGFVEWQTVGKEKIPYFIHPKDSDLFLIGGLYDHWVNPSTGETLKSFSIITTDANPMMAEIHNSKKRMPFILDDDKAEQWLDGNSKSQIESLFSSFDERQMAAYKISKEVNSSKNHRNVPEILSPVMDSGLSQLSLF